MKTIEVSLEFYNAAINLANYVDEFQNELDDFKRHVKEGNNPSDHVYNSAAIVGGWEDSINMILEEINQEIEAEEYRTQKRISN